MSFTEAKNNFLELTRGYSLLTSAAPWFAAAAAAAASAHYYSDVKIKLLTTFLSFVAIIFIHLGVNLFDDYIDIKKKLKQGVPLNEIKFEEKARFKGRLIINGTYSMKAVEKILCFLFGTGILIGAYFTFLYGAIIPVLALVAGLLCLFYPYSSKMYLSEAVVGLVFGPLLVMGTYMALTGRYWVDLLVLSVSIGLMIVVLLEAHNLMDYDYDKSVGKKTLMTLCKNKKNALGIIAGEIALSYIIIIYLCTAGKFSYWLLLSAILTLPLAIKLIFSLNDYNNIKDIKFIPKWYLGPMENWDIIRRDGFDYFMYRFYIARNLGFLFCVIIAVVCFFTIKINYIYI